MHWEPLGGRAKAAGLGPLFLLTQPSLRRIFTSNERAVRRITMRTTLMLLALACLTVVDATAAETVANGMDPGAWPMVGIGFMFGAAAVRARRDRART